MQAHEGKNTLVGLLSERRKGETKWSLGTKNLLTQLRSQMSR
jgi:hypothetical protein